MRTFRCTDQTCNEIILIVFPGDEPDEMELIQKIETHQRKFHLSDDELNEMLEG